MTRSLYFRYMFLTLANMLVLTACSGNTEIEPVLTAEPTNMQIEVTVIVEPTEAITIPASLTPTDELTGTPATVFLTPDFSPIAPGFLLAETPDCQLPCWQGLRVGISNRKDVQAMFDTVFGFDGQIDVFQENRQLLDSYELYGTEAGGHLWWVPEISEEPEGANFGLYFLVDKQSGILQGIQIVNAPFNTHAYETYTPQQVLQRLGEPSAAYIWPAIRGTIQLLLIYEEQGIASYMITQPIDEVFWTQDYPFSLATYCLDEQVILANSYITEPIAGVSEEELSPIQYVWFGERITLLRPIEIVGLTKTDLYLLATQAATPCIEIDYSTIPEY
jgi:hypothetical protein